MSKEIGKPFPDFKVLDGTVEVSNESLKGKVVLINFWFEACKPCMEEMKTLNDLYQKFEMNKNFEFISFARDNSEAIKRVQNKFSLKFKVFQVQSEECYRLNKNTGFPATMIVNRDGKIVYFTIGAINNTNGKDEKVTEMLLAEIRKGN